MPTSSDTQHAFLPAGRPAPDFKLTTVRTGREVCPKDCLGQPLGLVFHSRETIQAVVDINTAVRPKYPKASQVTLVSIIDLSSIPALLRGPVRVFLDQAYDQAAARIPEGYKPEDYVFLLPDWDGKVSRAFGVKGADKAAAVVVLDEKGIVVGSYQGPEPGPGALRLIEAALKE